MEAVYIIIAILCVAVLAFLIVRFIHACEDDFR